MSGNFTLSCCSTVDLPYSRMAERGIPVLFYTYTVDDTVYVDDMGRDTAAQDRFYEMLAAGKMPKTSQLNIDNYAQFFESLLAEGKDVLHIALGSGMSNSVNNAFLAVEMLAESGKLISMDLVEVNPVLDERNKTAILGAKMIQSALGESLY